MIKDVKDGSAAPQRFAFVQSIRVFLVSLVVAHHAAQPYGPTGGEWPVNDPVSNPWLGAFFALNAAFFMGFFFLIAGYFTGGSYDRKGGAAFVRSRLVRLGVPLAIFIFIVWGPVFYLLGDTPEGFIDFYLFNYIGNWQIEMGHLWFVAQLLVFSLLYALWRALTAGRFALPALQAPTDRTILAYVLALGLIGAMIRSVYPQDAWIWILGLVPAEPAHLPQYVSLFVIGIIAGRGRWFLELDPAVGLRWFLIGAVAFVISRNTSPDVLPPFVDRQVLWGVLEAFVCVGAILGTLVFFRRYFREPGRWMSRLDPSVFGVYLIHVFIVVGLQSALLRLDFPALVKFGIVTALGLIISFGLVGLIRRVPGIARVI